MSKWQGYLDTLSSVIKVIFFMSVMVVIGQIICNDAFRSLYVISDSTAIMVGESLLRIGQFLLWYSPLLFLMRLVVSKNRAYDNIMLAFIGYITFVVFSIYFGAGRMGLNAYRPILGITVSTSRLSLMANKVNEPIFTGIIGAIATVFVVRFVSNRVKNMHTIGLLGNVDIEFRSYIYVIVLSILASLLVSLAWPWFFSVIMGILNFIRSDLNNPVNLYIYGMMDRIMNLLGLTATMRTPFWYDTMGGSISTIAGQTVAGDVNMFAYSYAENLTNAGVGRLITPYYVFNIFVLPVTLIALYRVNSDILEKKRNRFMVFFMMLISIMGGGMFPFELLLLFLSPSLFIFHILSFGALFGILNSFHINLGFIANNATITAIPGNILEYITYLSNYRYRSACVGVAIVGIVVALLYYAVFTIYFKKLNVDSFGANCKPVAKAIVKAFGGVGNLKYVNASLAHISVQVFDPNAIDLYQLKKVGATKVVEKRSGYTIFFGGKSFMIKRCIDAIINASVRTVE